MKPIAFVIPWYGDDIRGGAESECNQLAHCIAESGIAVEVLCTCVKEASDARGINNIDEGTFIESGITVRRFKVKKQNLDRYIPANLKLYRNEKITEEDEIAYLEEDINSPELYEYIKNNCDNYKWFIFIPYLYPPTYWGSINCPDNAVIIPCLHDEGYAYMSLMKKRMMHFKKMIFLSKPEYDLADLLYDLKGVNTAVLGAYVESGWEKLVKPERFRNKYNVEGDFILCAGRKDPGKKTDMLLSYFCRYIDNHPERNIKLIFIGGGEIEIPERYFNKSVFDLGFVSQEDKYDAYSAAYILCNPSFFESFSIVIMESWLAKRPVLVAEQCKVTTNFCLESNGGLFFDSYSVFQGCLEYMFENRKACDVMGINGYQYVQANFVKKSIQKKYIEFLELG